MDNVEHPNVRRSFKDFKVINKGARYYDILIDGVETRGVTDCYIHLSCDAPPTILLKCTALSFNADIQDGIVYERMKENDD